MHARSRKTIANPLNNKMQSFCKRRPRNKLQNKTQMMTKWPPETGPTPKHTRWYTTSRMLAQNINIQNDKYKERSHCRGSSGRWPARCREVQRVARVGSLGMSSFFASGCSYRQSSNTNAAENWQSRKRWALLLSLSC